MAALLAGAAEPDPEAAIRTRARALVEEVRGLLGFEGPPFDVAALASYCGFQVRYGDGFSQSQDACISPGVIVVNLRKPRRRQRFSIAHEIVHTLFPDYAEQLSRAGALWRDEAMPSVDPGEALLEHLCQVGAAELLLPQFAFEPALMKSGLSLNTVVSLSDAFDASIESSARRAVDLSPSAAAVALVLPHDAAGQALKSTTYSPYADLRVARVYPNAGFGHTLLSAGSRPPKKSVVFKAWKRAPHPTLSADTYEGSEEWSNTTSVTGESLTTKVEAMVLPHRALHPAEVLALFQRS